MEIQATYIGKRATPDYKVSYAYFVPLTRETIKFAKRLGSFDVLGDIIKMEQVSEASYKFISKIGHVSVEEVSKYSIEERASLELIDKYRLSKQYREKVKKEVVLTLHKWSYSEFQNNIDELLSIYPLISIEANMVEQSFHITIPFNQPF